MKNCRRKTKEPFSRDIIFRASITSSFYGISQKLVMLIIFSICLGLSFQVSASRAFAADPWAEILVLTDVDGRLIASSKKRNVETSATADQLTSLKCYFGGTTPSTRFTVELKVDGKTLYSRKGFYSDKENVAEVIWWAESGRHTFECIVDSGNALKEGSGESNNRQTMSYLVANKTTDMFNPDGTFKGPLPDLYIKSAHWRDDTSDPTGRKKYLVAVVGNRGAGTYDGGAGLYDGPGCDLFFEVKGVASGSTKFTTRLVPGQTKSVWYKVRAKSEDEKLQGDQDVTIKIDYPASRVEEETEKNNTYRNSRLTIPTVSSWPSVQPGSQSGSSGSSDKDSSKSANSRDTKPKGIGSKIKLDMSKINNDTGVTYNNPKFKGQNLDWCLNWGKDCGKPAADAWCYHEKGKLLSIAHKRKKESPPTVIFTSGKLCTNDRLCDTFASITCSSRSASEGKEFIKPPPKPAQSVATGIGSTGKRSLTPSEKEKMADIKMTGISFSDSAGNKITKGWISTEYKQNVTCNWDYKNISKKKAAKTKISVQTIINGVKKTHRGVPLTAKKYTVKNLKPSKTVKAYCFVDSERKVAESIGHNNVMTTEMKMRAGTGIGSTGKKSLTPSQKETMTDIEMTKITFSDSGGNKITKGWISTKYKQNVTCNWDYKNISKEKAAKTKISVQTIINGVDKTHRNVPLTAKKYTVKGLEPSKSVKAYCFVDSGRKVAESIGRNNVMTKEMKAGDSWEKPKRPKRPKRPAKEEVSEKPKRPKRPKRE